MEQRAKLTSNKRKRPSPSSTSHPLIGVFTRRKSQIYFHCNRSGRARFDSFHHTNPQSTPVEFQSPNNILRRRRQRIRRASTRDSADTTNLSRVSVKDLRARRVFSLGSVANNECGLCVNGEERKGSEKECEKIEDGFCFDKEDVVKSDVKVMSTNFDEIEGNGRASVGDSEILNGFGDLNEECVQATPPDAEVFGYGCENGGNKVESVSQNMEKVSGKQLTESVQRSGNFQHNICKEHCRTSGTKSVLSQCSRVRVFKNPGSFSYRRLLPYLMDMTKDKPCNPKTGNSSNIEGKGIFINISARDSSSMGFHAGASQTLSKCMPISANDLSDSNLTSTEWITNSSMLLGSQKGLSMRVYSSTSLVDECCSKPIVNEGNGKIEIGIPWENDNLNNWNPEGPSSVENSHLNNMKPVHGAETKRIDGGFSSNAQDANDMNDTRDDFPLIAGKLQLGGDDVVKHSGYKMQTETVDADTFDIEHPFTEIVPNQISTNLLDTEGNSRTCDVEEKVDDDGDVLDKIDGANEESMQMTSPDFNIFHKSKMNENVDNRIERVLHNSDLVLGKELNGSIHRHNSYANDKKMDSNSKSKLGLNQCSGLKLFKIPNSFSYRRLLPYRMNMIKENAVASRHAQCRKLEKSSEENQPSALVNSNLYETSAEKFNSKSCHLELDTGNSPTIQKAMLATSGTNQPNLTSPQQSTETPVSFSSQEQELQVVEVSLDKDKQLEVAADIVSSIRGSSSSTISLCSSVSPKSFSEDCLKLVQHGLSIDNEGCTTSVVRLTNSTKPVESDILSQNSSQLEATDPLGVPVCESRKGILKRSPRGCRGICTCLNCASFHLHAQRAFEFSRNQMKDAEEVALDLIKELSHIRNMLEISASGSDDRHVFSINQVKEACRKASQAEQLAKNRLSQMNYDLSIHCRITCGQRPRVRFANIVEERVIP